MEEATLLGIPLSISPESADAQRTSVRRTGESERTFHILQPCTRIYLTYSIYLHTLQFCSGRGKTILQNMYLLWPDCNGSFFFSFSFPFLCPLWCLPNEEKSLMTPCTSNLIKSMKLYVSVGLIVSVKDSCRFLFPSLDYFRV